jgi:O-antigen/teichoic acid export membrane protein
MIKMVSKASVYELFTRFTGIILNFILIGLLFKNIDSDSLGLWFVLTAVSGFMALITFGFSPTFIRNLASKKEQKHGNSDYIELIKFGRQFYSYLQFIVIFSYTLFGFLVIFISSSHVIDGDTILIILMLGVGYAIMLKAQYYNDILIAEMRLIQNKHIQLFYGVSQALILMASATIAGDLFYLALASLFVHIVYLKYTKFIFKRVIFDIYLKTLEKTSKFKIFFKLFFNDLKKYWLMSLGSFVILETDLLFLMFFFGAEEVPDYKAMYTIIFTCFTISLIFMKNMYSLLSKDFARQEIKTFSDVEIYPTISLLFFSSSIIFILPNIEYIMEIWIGADHFIGYNIVIIFTIMLFFELQHTSLAIISISSGNIPFAKVAMIAALLNIVFTFYFQSVWGIFGVALGTLLAQLLTNNWYVIHITMQLFKKSIWYFVKRVTFPILIYIFTGLLFNILVINLMTNQIYSLVATGAISILSLALIMTKTGIMSKIQST